MLREPDAVIPEVMLKITYKAFFEIRNRLLFEAILAAHEMGAPVQDVRPVAEILNNTRTDTGQSKLQVVTLQHVMDVFTTRVSPLRFQFYLEIVEVKHLGRRALRKAAEMQHRILTEQDDLRAVIMECSEVISKVSEDAVVTANETLKDLARKRIDELETLITGVGEAHKEYIKTGIADYDRLNGGFTPSDYVIIAARPSLGKTALALKMAGYMSIENRLPVGIITLESTMMKLFDRMVTARSRVPVLNLEAEVRSKRDAGADVEGVFSAKSIALIQAAMVAVSDAPIHFAPMTSPTISQVAAMGRKLKRDHDIKALFIDYIGKIRAPKSMENKSDHEKMGYISNELVTLKNDLGIPVIVLSQLNRGPEADNRRPKLSDLKNSGDLEQDGDVILLLHNAQPPEDSDDGDGKKKRQPKKDTYERERGPTPVDIIAAKVKDGQTGDIPMVFIKDTQRFVPRMSESNLLAGHYE